MDQATTYRVSRNLTIQIDRKGRLIASTSFSLLPRELGPEGIPLLLAFSGGGTPGRVREALAAEWEFDDEGFAEAVDALIDQGLLVPDGGGGPASSDGFATLQAQHFMVRDTVRVMAYRAAIAAHARGRSVVEIGCGTGLLSVFAAQAGARRVVAIEETAIAGLAREMARANGFENVVEVVSANSRDVELDEPAELLIHEILGADPFAENVVPYLQDARERFLQSGGRMIPYRLEILCAGTQIEDRGETMTRDQAIREARELAGLYGLDLSAYLRALEQGQDFRRNLNVTDERFPYPILSGECRLYDLDLSSDLSGMGGWVEAQLDIQAPGELTSLILYFRAHLDERICLTTSPFAPRTHWGWSLRDLDRTIKVAPGDRVALRAQVDTVMGRQKLRLGLA